MHSCTQAVLNQHFHKPLIKKRQMQSHASPPNKTVTISGPKGPEEKVDPVKLSHPISKMEIQVSFRRKSYLSSRKNSDYFRKMILEKTVFKGNETVFQTNQFFLRSRGNYTQLVFERFLMDLFAVSLGVELHFLKDRTVTGYVHQKVKKVFVLATGIWPC